LAAGARLTLAANRRAVWQPPLDPCALPPGPCQEVGACLHIPLGIKNIQKQAHEIAVRCFEEMRLFERLPSATEISLPLTEQTLAE
jgi:hypothetical protein